LSPAFTFSHDGLAAGEEPKGVSQFGNETSHEQYWQFLLLLTPAFTFFHDGLTTEKEPKGVSQFGNKTLHKQYWQFVLVLTPLSHFPMMAWQQQRNKQV
jgi:hypothetical protein